MEDLALIFQVLNSSMLAILVYLALENRRKNK